jgi:predicted TIM-barrel fold metal-dependent hydrolase
MSRWREIPKIDAHVHVVLHQRENTDLTFNPLGAMLRAMDAHNVERAVVLPINHPEYFPLEGEECADWLRASNERQAGIARESDGRLIAFADCAIDGKYGYPSLGVAELHRAIAELGLAGLKIHASNLKAITDDPRILPWIDAAAGIEVPVVFHSNPSGHDPEFDGSAPSRIYKSVYGRAVTYVIAHMGGVSYLETLVGGGYVGISGTLLWLADLYGLPFCKRFLRRIGIDRLLFATDFPVYPYEAYYEILDRLELTDDEIEKVAHVNAERMLAGLPPVDPTAQSTSGSPIG